MSLFSRKGGKVSSTGVGGRGGFIMRSIASIRPGSPTVETTEIRSAGYKIEIIK